MIMGLIIFIVFAALCLIGFAIYLKWDEKCKHQWVKVDEEKIWPSGIEKTEDNYRHRIVIMQCKHCGEIKKVNIC